MEDNVPRRIVGWFISAKSGSIRRCANFRLLSCCSFLPTHADIAPPTAFKVTSNGPLRQSSTVPA
eukprot:523633-Amphidinium_carterae.1